MSRLMTSVAVLASIVAAGCAATLEQPGDQAATGTPQAATASLAAADPADAPPTLVVNAEDQDPNGAVICRDVLKQGSNVITTECMTADGWRLYKRRQERDAQEILRMLQGGAYR